MEGRICKTLVDSVAKAEKDLLVWDKDLSGFGLKVTPSGRKIYILQYRPLIGGRVSVTKRYTIGRHGSPWTAETARLEAKRLLKLVDEGRDPMAEKQVARSEASAETQQADTVSTAIDRFVEAYAKKNAPRHWREIERTLKYDPGRVWGDRTPDSITAKDAAGLFEAIVARGAPSQANHVYRALVTFFGWCASPAIGLIPVSPMIGLEKPGPDSFRDRVLEDWELRLIWHSAAEQGYPFGPCVQLLMLTAQRRDEVAHLTRGELDFDKALWTLPAERAKNGKLHLTPLAPMALTILKALPWEHALAFTTTGTTPVSGFSRLKERLDRAILRRMRQEAAEAGRDPDTVKPLAHWTFHDFRRSVSSTLAQLNVPLHVTEKLLNHQPQAIRGVAAIYNRYEYLDERRLALERWEGRLRQLVAPGLAPSVP